MSENPKAPEFVEYNLFGLRPVAASFQIDTERFERLVQEIVSAKISGVQNITIEPTDKGTVILCAWFDARGDHFMDKSTKDSALRQGIPSISPQMKEFVSKFGWNEADENPEGGNTKVNMGAIIVKNSNPEISQRLMGVRLAINPIVFNIFDMMNTTYTTTYGINPPKCTVRREWRWRSGPKGKYNTLVGIVITKKLSGSVFDKRDKPRAQRGGKFN